MTDVDARPQQASRQDTGEYAYQRGFGNEFASEAVAGALPAGRNSPQRAPLGLFAEQLSGTAFTQPRAVNRRTWVYRIMPSAAHPRFARIGNGTLRATPFDEIEPDPNRLRWNALPVPDAGSDFVDGLYTMAGNGDLRTRNGIAVHVYAANRSMTDRYSSTPTASCSSCPNVARSRCAPSSGRWRWRPARSRWYRAGSGSRWNCRTAIRELARGYLCENFGAAFTLPNAARSGPTAWPTSATSWPRQRPTRTGPGPCRWCRSSAGTCGPPTTTTHRSTSWAGTGTTRRTSTTRPVSW